MACIGTVPGMNYFLENNLGTINFISNFPFYIVFYIKFLHYFLTSIFYTIFLHQFFTPFYMNFLHHFFTSIFYTIFYINYLHHFLHLFFYQKIFYTISSRQFCFSKIVLQNFKIWCTKFFVLKRIWRHKKRKCWSKKANILGYNKIGVKNIPVK